MNTKAIHCVVWADGSVGVWRGYEGGVDGEGLGLWVTWREFVIHGLPDCWDHAPIRVYLSAAYEYALR